MGVCDVPCKPFLQVIDVFTADYCMQRTVGMGVLQIGVTASVPDGTLSITVRRCARRLTVVFDCMVTVRSRVDQATAKKADKSHLAAYIQRHVDILTFHRELNKAQTRLSAPLWDDRSAG